MLIVQIVGGLGNQMYGYALYRTFLERGRNVYMDLSFYDHQDSPVVTARKYELAEVFNITERITKISNLRKLFISAANRLKISKFCNIYRDKNTNFQPEILELHNGILQGYWQSFRYSAEIENILRKEFTFKKTLTGKSAEVIDKIRNSNSVSISFRRGDYLKLGGALSVLTDDYYSKAINYIQERVPNAKFFCTSDDIDWCKENYSKKGLDIEFIDWSLDENQYFDMQVISECKYNILANSTFCLWGAWLNQNPDKIVLRPEWFPNRKDFWPDEWTLIS